MISLITGMSNEAKVIRKAIKETDAGNVQVFVAGLGVLDGEKVVKQAIANGAKGIVSIGVCGAIDKILIAGQVVIPEQILAYADKPLPYEGVEINHDWRNALLSILEADYFVTSAPLLSVNKQISTIEEKLQLHQDTSACAVDMESGKLGVLAKQHGLPYIVVRVVIDVADQAIPAAFEKVIRPDGSFSVFELIKGLIFKWPGAKAFDQLTKNNNEALTNLAGLTGLALPDFKLPDFKRDK